MTHNYKNRSLSQIQRQPGLGEWLRVEFHCHTIASKDCLTTPEELIAACRRKSIDRVVITDHNSIHAAQIAKDLAPELVIVGEEIMTQSGELLAFFVREAVPPDLPVEQAINLLRQQDAFISVSHPYDVMRAGSWKEEELQTIAPYVDAIEIFNSRCFLAMYNEKAASFAARRHLPGTVGSDAHTIWELGRSTLWLPPFTDALDLKQSIRAGIPAVRASPFWVHFFSRYATLVKKLIQRRRIYS